MFSSTAAMAMTTDKWDKNVVEHPACECCPHTELSELERDELAREVWDMCPASGCLRQFCRFCPPRSPRFH